jgi:hypothetical protein
MCLYNAKETVAEEDMIVYKVFGFKHNTIIPYCYSTKGDFDATNAVDLSDYAFPAAQGYYTFNNSVYVTFIRGYHCFTTLEAAKKLPPMCSNVVIYRFTIPKGTKIYVEISKKTNKPDGTLAAEVLINPEQFIVYQYQYQKKGISECV